MNEVAKSLDRIIPLSGASHAEVVDYTIAIPMRYAECIARLRDGREVRLSNPRQLVGWSNSGNEQKILFRNGGSGIEISIDAGQKPCVREVHIGDSRVTRAAAVDTIQVHKLITRDGSLLYTALQAEVPNFVGSSPNRWSMSGVGADSVVTTSATV